MYWRAAQGWEDVQPTAITLADRAFQLGDGVFETFRIDEGAIRHSQIHRRSLEAACAAMALAPPDWQDIEAGVAKLMAGPCIGKLQVTRGPGARGLAPPARQKEALYLQFSPQPDRPEPIHLVTSSIRRSTTSLAARFKTLSYADNLAARREAASKSADMALLLTESGLLSGGDCANLFWVSGGQLHTPSTGCGVRNGVLRQCVIDWADKVGVQVTEAEAGPDALDNADCAFLTNAVMGVVPAASINGHRLPGAHDMLEALAEAKL